MLEVVVVKQGQQILDKNIRWNIYKWFILM